MRVLPLLAAVTVASAVCQGMPMSDKSPVYQVESCAALNLREAVTLEAWVKAGALPQVGARLLDRHQSGTDDGYLLDTFPGNSLRMITANGAVSFAAGLTGDRWWHVVGVYDSAARIQKLYVDGREVAAKTTGDFPKMVMRDLPLRLGANQAGGERLTGAMARAAIYGRALSAAEIAARAQAGPEQAKPLDGALGDWLLPDRPGRSITPAAGTLKLATGTVDVDLTGQAIAPEGRWVTWYRQPAAQWVEALPVGNGRLGAMVFGGVARDRLQLNEGTFWAGGPYEPGNFDVREPLAQARELVFAGKYREAQKLVDDKLFGRPKGQMSYQPIGDLLLTFPGGDTASDYRRELDLDSAVAKTIFVRDGVTYTREVLSSPVDQVIAVRLTADRRGALNLSAGLRSPQRGAQSVVEGDTVVLTGNGPDYRGIKGAMTFECRARLLPTGGKLSVDGTQLKLADADSCTVLVSIATNYVNYKDASADPHARAIKPLDAAAKRTWAELRARHVTEHQRLFRRVDLDLGGWQAAVKPTDERVRAIAQGADDPALAALYFQFGRYLLASCSRAGGQAATLQGLWNESTSPPWDSKYTTNINTQMNYWPAEPGNLADCAEPLWRLISDCADQGRAVAREHYGARGWVLHQNTDLFRVCAPMDGTHWGTFTPGGAWLCQHLLEHWRHSGDRDHLAGVYPILRGAALFFLDFLVEHPEHGWLVTNPSGSPENVPDRPGRERFFDEVTTFVADGSMICCGSTIDVEIVADLFDGVAEVAEVLGRDRAFAAKLRAARRRLPPLQVGADGTLQEWLEDWGQTETSHRHISHLYAVYPGTAISRDRNPELAAAAAAVLEQRGLTGNGWSSAWKAACWARLGRPERALDNLAYYLRHYTTASLFALCSGELQVDGALGICAAVMEMLLQSHTGELHLLPALPAEWPDGQVRGLRARGGFEVDLVWQAGALREAAISSAVGGQVAVRWADQRATLDLAPGQRSLWLPSGV